jgi:uncharacterized coiled-coil DUF342 family protein
MTERWTDERLDRFASSVDNAISELSQVQLRMMQEFSEYRRDMTEMRADIREMQAEVRGLQTENRRILDRLFGQQSN